MNNRMDGQNPMLLDKLTDYAGTDHYPFHMPGHKRQVQNESLRNPYAVDITEWVTKEHGGVHTREWT